TPAFADNNKKAKAYYFAAEEAYNNKQYESALNGIKKTEELLGKSNAVLEGLRVKVLFELKDYQAAKQALDKFYTYKASPELEKDIAPYLLKIDEAFTKLKRENSQVQLFEVLKEKDTTPETIQELIDYGADVKSKKNKQGNYPIHLAAKYNPNPDVIRKLIVHGASVDRNNNGGWNSIMFAAKYNNDEVIKVLLKARKFGLGLDKAFWTPLMLAARYNENVNVTRLLIEATADVNHANGYGRIPNVNDANEYGWTALMLAAKYNTAEVFESLLEAGADITAKNYDGTASALDLITKRPELQAIVYQRERTLSKPAEKSQIEQSEKQQLIELRKQQLEKQSSDKVGSSLQDLLR
ncbi:MAG: ankyrin repeat domain-containing protein, partial [Proteobacteria bacterium]|nr:ankyrin repeat domain-containing protein [Pseudomonadota bacterium]